MNPMNVGWIFAARWEASPFLRRKSALKVADAPFPLYRMESEEAVSWAIVTGMGPEAARAGTWALIEKCEPQGIVNAGLAGGLTPEMTIGSKIKVTHASLIDTDRPLSPVFWYGRENPGKPEASFGAARKEKRLLTVTEPVFDTRLRTTLSQWGDLVDMEGAAIVAVCHEAEIPCTLIKLISDLADDGARKGLQENMKTHCRLLADLLEPLSPDELEMNPWKPIHPTA
ncbi:MAG: hypothetical protein HQL76_10385 [Magnetococcales bacterium]|nr:hypothetical protein [Magnetococcales bacterium]